MAENEELKREMVEIRDPVISALHALFESLEAPQAQAAIRHKRIPEKDHDDSKARAGARDKTQYWLNSLNEHREMCELIDEPWDTALHYIHTVFPTFSDEFKLMLVNQELELRALQTPEPTIEQLLKPASERFETIAGLLAQLTPKHLAMQGHLESFIAAGPIFSFITAEQRDALYASLKSLRNEYFLAPRSGVVSRYLELVELTSDSKLYTRYSQGSVGNSKLNEILQKEIKKHQDALEVMSLLEVIE
jgi:hypothetical protein